MKAKKDNLLNTIADLIKMLLQHGENGENIVSVLKFNGFTKQQIAELFFGLEQYEKLTQHNPTPDNPT